METNKENEKALQPRRVSVGRALAYAPAAIWLPLGALGVAGLAGRGPRVLRKDRLLSGLLTAGGTLGLAYWQLSRLFTEKPPYVVERKQDGFEVRRYDTRVVAETTVGEGEWEEALREGFRRLAGYIFGANSGKQELGMTAPVTASGKHPEKIAMTAPVTASKEETGVTVTFTMPRERTLDSLPAPADERIRLRERPAQRVAALRFRGTYGRRLKERRESELLARVRQAGLDPSGAPVFAGYDAPSTLPFLRRVEIWVPLA